MNIVSLLTDFGTQDGNVGVMKAVIWGIAPRAQITDLSHAVPPQNIRHAALLLARSAPYFPDDSVHCVVVDPGVGTGRRPIAARLGRQRYVAPDNGVLTLALAEAEAAGLEIELVHLDQPQFWREEISKVFHGRDIFAPVAGHLAAGVPLVALGTPMDDPVRIDWPQPARTDRGWKTEVIYIDRFGNLVTGLKREVLGDRQKLQVRLRGQSVPGLVGTFGERPPGTLTALYGSTGYLIVAEVNGSAQARLEADVGDPVDVLIEAGEEQNEPGLPRS